MMLRHLPRLRSLLAPTLVAAVLVGACTKEPASSTSSQAADPPAEAGEVPAEPGEVLPDAAELLAAHVEAAGGADKIASFETIHATGTVSAAGQKLSGTMEMWWMADGRFYVQQEIEGAGETRVGYDGSTIWLDDPITGLRVLEGEEAASYLQTSLMFPGHDWQQHFSAAKTIGRQKEGEVWEVELESKRGVNMTVGLDIETKLIRYMTTTLVTPMGPMPVEAHSESYKAVDGYKFSMKKRSSIKSLLELQETIDVFETNVAVDQALFQFPATREQVAADPSAQPPVVAPAPAPAP